MHVVMCQQTGGNLASESSSQRVSQSSAAHLDGVLVGQDVDDLEGVLHDAASHQLLSAVSAVLHEGAGQSLNDGALLC
jgi:hypothetical protein